MPSTHPALTFSLADTPSAIGDAKILLPLSVARDAARFHGVDDAIVLAKPFRRRDLPAALAQAVE